MSRHYGLKAETGRFAVREKTPVPWEHIFVALLPALVVLSFATTFLILLSGLLAGTR